MNSRIGAQVGAFRIRSLLGRGASAEVYLAHRADAFQQRVAVKLFEGGDAAEVFTTEAARLAQLSHPAIVKLVDRGELPDGAHYLIMEYADGVPVDEYCADPARGWRERLWLLVGIAEALAHAHRHLVIHADIKPSNILVSKDGEPHLLDFGGGGTALFASPEQRDRQPLSAASDVYSLGVLARFVMAGAGVSGAERAPDCAAAVPWFGRDLRAVLDKATRPEREERYASMELLAADFRRVLAGRDVDARPASVIGRGLRWSLRHRLRVGTLAVIGLLALVAGGKVASDGLRAARARAVAESQLQRVIGLTGEFQGELYQSAARLPQSQGARAILLDGARRTLAALVAQQGGNQKLALDLAGQYLSLAKLDRAGEKAQTSRAAQLSSAVDIAQARLLLARVTHRDDRYRALDRELDALTSGR